MKSRVISAILLISMLASLAACGGTPENGDVTTTPTESGDTTPAVTGREAVSDGLPDKKFDKTFTILTRTNYDYEFAADEESGELINDAVYKRNTTVEDRFGVEIETVPMDCNWGNEATQFNTTLRASIMAGGGEYDLVAGYAATITALVSDELFLNWMDLDYVDFSKPWWSEKVADELTINGKCFLATGDISIVLWNAMRAMFFNKRLADDYQCEDFYELVKSGKWTFDKLISVTKDIYADLDGDGKKTDADLYGMLLGWSTEIDNFKEAFEIPVTKKGNDGFPYIAVKSDRIIDAAEKMNSWVHDNDGVLFIESDYKTKLPAAFSEGRGLLFSTTLGKSELMRSMNDDFGIIPYPKWDESQEEYHSTSVDEFTLFVIPKDIQDLEMTSIITEALCAESYKKVVPTFYDVALKTKAARDNESSDMIDLIRDGLTFDFGYLHSSALGSAGHAFVGFIRNNTSNVASSLDSKMSTYEEKLDILLKPYR